MVDTTGAELRINHCARESGNYGLVGEFPPGQAGVTGNGDLMVVDGLVPSYDESTQLVCDWRLWTFAGPFPIKSELPAPELLR